MTKLTDERLDCIEAIGKWARENGMAIELPHDDVEAMAHELRSRRARDLTAEEREALRWLRERAHTHLDITPDAEGCPHCAVGKAALAALDKLLAPHPEEQS